MDNVYDKDSLHNHREAGGENSQRPSGGRGGHIGSDNRGTLAFELTEANLRKSQSLTFMEGGNGSIGGDGGDGGDVLTRNEGLLSVNAPGAVIRGGAGGHASGPSGNVEGASVTNSDNSQVHVEHDNVQVPANS
ncbi:hypothetical protein SISNIDRAFT_464649 [Sistotremastrum niveocremeum HHB9708]|uniref:Uncharacterized protein n=1 Tax=Sistotremastrum niveocremeum HHB9708 TaxID=1314777 RepID=A0A164X5R3_9AGAM|nr:hypothetical protein SISNIDRAFT_464649 [Sistotremastrum niveocremeum HHB9708]